MTYLMILPEEAPAGEPTAVAEFDAAVLRFASDDLLWVLQAKVERDRFSDRSTPTRYGTKFSLPPECWYALERLILAETVSRIGRCQPELGDDNYDSEIDSLADWLCSYRWALGLMDLRHQQGGQVWVRSNDTKDWTFYATGAIYAFKHQEVSHWNPRLEAYIKYINTLLQMQINPGGYLSLKPSDVREAFDRFLEISEATTVDAISTAPKALPPSQEAIAERLNRQLSS